ncbi:type II toxin-antitoxin system RelE/ParE family toxin [Rhizobium sp.]
MPQIVVSPGARDDLQRCYRFLQPKNPDAARRAASALKRGIKRLATTPEIGRPFGQSGILRELLIPFGDSGYSVLYTFDAARDTVIALAVKHQREEAY